MPQLQHLTTKNLVIIKTDLLQLHVLSRLSSLRCIGFDFK